MKAVWNKEYWYMWRLETGVVGMRASILMGSPKEPKPFRVTVCSQMPDSNCYFKTLREAKGYAVRIMKVRAKKLVKALA